MRVVAQNILRGKVHPPIMATLLYSTIRATPHLLLLEEAIHHFMSLPALLHDIFLTSSLKN